jgi:hypothetical protein
MLTYTYQTFYPMANRGFLPGHKADINCLLLVKKQGMRILYFHDLIPLPGMILRHMTILSYFYCRRFPPSFDFNIQTQEC